MPTSLWQRVFQRLLPSGVVVRAVVVQHRWVWAGVVCVVLAGCGGCVKRLAGLGPGSKAVGARRAFAKLVVAA
jgi:hypothetical protein